MTPNSVTKPCPKKAKKTRIKVPSSCSICRKRKIKCNKQRPHCGNCVEHSLTHLCLYETQPWAEVSKAHNNNFGENDRLRRLVESLEAEVRQKNSEIFLLTNNSNDSANNDETLLDNTYITFGFQHITTAVKDLRIIQFGPTSYMFLLLNDPYITKIFGNYLQNQAHKYQARKDAILNSTSVERVQDTPSMDECLRKQQKYRYEEIPTLPHMTVIKLLVYRFFSMCYPFAPFIDERSFMNKVSAMLVNGTTLSKDIIMDNKELVASLLIVLRFSFLTIPFKKYHDGDLQGEELQMAHEIILSNINISSNYIDYSKELLLSPDVIGGCNFTGFQALLLLLVYKAYSPEDDDSNAELSVMMSASVQISRNISLNLDPTDMKMLSYSNDEIQLWRKTWAVLLYLDASRAFSSGMPLLILEGEIKTKSPFKDLENNFIWLARADVDIEFGFDIMMKSTELMRKTLHLTSKGSSKVSDVDSLITEFSEIYSRTRSFLEDSNTLRLPITDPHRAQVFLLEISILEHWFTLNFTVHISIDGSQNKSYLFQALELGLLIFQKSLAFAEDPRSVCECNLEYMIAPRMWTAARTVISALAGVLNQSISGRISILEMSGRFTEPNKTTLRNTFIIEENEWETLKNIIQKFDKLFQITKHLSTKFFHCYRPCYTLKIVLDFFEENHGDLFKETKSSHRQSYCSTQPTFLESYWEANTDLHSLNFDFEQFLQELNLDLDPIMNFQ